MREIEIPAPHGVLEAIFEPALDARCAVVVCHPHPKLGGTMHQPIAYRVADAFRGLGCTVLRFNFRGVGRSTGQYDDARGEVEDVGAAVAFVAAQTDSPIAVAGYSFGAYVGLRYASADSRVTRALGIGIATALFDHAFVSEMQKPVALVQGDSDDYGPLAQVEPLVGPSRRLFTIERCDHFGTGRLNAVAERLREAASWVISQ